MRNREYSTREIDRFLNNRKTVLANRRAVLAERLTDDEKIAVQMLLDEKAFSNARKAIQAIRNGDVSVYDEPFEDVLRDEVAEGVFDFEFISQYVDYDRLANDMRTNKYVIEDNGYTVIVH